MLEYKFNFRRVCVFMIFFILTPFQNTWGEEVDILQGNIRFKLEIKGHGLKYFVRVNDVIIFSQYYQENQNYLVLPINQWMHPETSKFSIEAGPTYGGDFPANGSASIALLIEDRDSDVNYRLPIIKIESSEVYNQKDNIEGVLNAGRYNLSDDNQVIFGEGNVELSKVNKESTLKGWFEYDRTVTAPNNLPLWAFFNSEELPNGKTMSKNEIVLLQKGLYLEYQKVQRALASGDIDSIMPMYEEHNREVELAFNYEPGSMDEMIKNNMVEAINTPGNTLVTAPFSSLAMNVEKNNKLISLMFKRRVNAVGFKNENGLYTSFPLMFRRENGKWILTR